MLIKEIHDVIKQNLPQETGNALLSILEEKKKTEEELRTAGTKIRSLEESVQRLLARNDEYEKIINKHENLDRREAEISQKESVQKVSELTIRLEAGEMVNNRIMNFVDALMRNTTFRENIVYEHSQMYCSNNEYATVTTNKNTEKTVE